MATNDVTDRLSSAAIQAPDEIELALARATAALAAPEDPVARRELLELLGLTEEAGRRIHLRDLAWRPDHTIKRAPGAPAATAPDSPAVIKARAEAKKRRREAAKDHLRAQGLSGRELKSALARMEG